MYCNNGNGSQVAEEKHGYQFLDTPDLSKAKGLRGWQQKKRVEYPT